MHSAEKLTVLHFGHLAVDWHEEEILNMQKDFYQELYRKNPATVFTAKTEEKIIPKQIREEQQKHFQMSEMAIAIKELKNNKVPGPDGIPIDFYKVFFGTLKDPLYDAIEYAYNTKNIHTTAKKGVLSLIPKSGRDA